MSKRKNVLQKQCRQLKDANYKHLNIVHDHSNTGEVLLVKGSEEDFYPNEQAEIIIEILKEHLEKYVRKNSRRADILRSIIAANPVDGIPEKLKSTIKKAFEGYKQFNCVRISEALKLAGLEVTVHSGHYKVRHGKDTRYMAEVAATPSDRRAGKNAAAIINRLMF